MHYNGLLDSHFPSRYTEGNDTYIFAPAEDGINTQSFTIHRSSGDIVLNRSLKFIENGIANIKYNQDSMPLCQFMPAVRLEQYTAL
jgi:hypothetical protein